MSTNNTYHYTAADIQRYLSGSMSPQEMHDMELAALNDPLLADAIDGYRHADTSITAKHLNEINASLQNKKQGRVTTLSPHKTQWWRWLAAASIIGVLAFTSWYFLNNNHSHTEQIVQAKPEEKDTTTLQTMGDTLQAATTKIESSAKISEIKTTGKNNLPKTEAYTKEKNETPETVVQENTEIISSPNNALVSVQSKSQLNNVQNEMRSIAGINISTEKNDAEAMAKNQAPAPQTIKLRGVSSTKANDNTGVFWGIITDQNNNPVPMASIVISGTNKGASSDANGVFKIANINADSIKDVSISAVGYEQQYATLLAGKVAGIRLKENNQSLNEVIVVGYGTQKKKAMVGAIAKKEPEINAQNSLPYPQGGWDKLYDKIYSELKIDKAKATKPLHIKFAIDSGRPSQFQIVQTPDSTIANKAISFIQNGPKWKNYQLVKTSEIKLMVE